MLGDGSFARDGFEGPLRILTVAECAAIVRRLRSGLRPAPLDWRKGGAATDRLFHDLATRPELLDRVRARLGDDVVLWGAEVIDRRPGRIHPWHADKESLAESGGFVSVWIGIENTCRESTLKLVTRSHAFGAPLQRLTEEHGLDRHDVDDRTVLAWARGFDPQAELVQPDATDGEAILFDGRLWHGSRNARSRGVRRAILLQYAAADTPVFLRGDRFPFQPRSDLRPPVVVVAGRGLDDRNRIVLPPLRQPPLPEPLTTHVRPIDLPLAEDPDERWRAHPFFRGSSPVLEKIACHASVLGPGRSPHAPHAHDDEELLIPLDGEAELVIGGSSRFARTRVERLGPGAFVYYPAHRRHTIRNPGPSPITYLMFKWRAAPAPTSAPLETTIVRFGDLAPPPFGRKGYAAHRLLAQPTSCLGKLQSHVTFMAPGAGYEPHADRHDVAIVVLAGAIEVVGETVKPSGIVWISAGALHGMRSVGDEPARYLVFEFHGADSRSRRGRWSRLWRRARRALRRRR